MFPDHPSTRMPASEPNRNPDDALTPRPCRVCWREFSPCRANNIYCSIRCKNTAFYRREQVKRRNQVDSARDDHQTPGRTPPAPHAAAVRSCPHCGEPVTIVALLTTPEAARPRTPSATDTVIPLHRPPHDPF